MSATKGVFENRSSRRKNDPMKCCGSTHHSIHASACKKRFEKPKIDPRKAKVQKLKEKGYLSQEVAQELKMKLGDVNKLWI